MITCDGTGFDCQAQGTVNMMENHMYKIQGYFEDVGAREQQMVKRWGLTEGATLANDIAIEFKPDNSMPIVQVGFGHVEGYEFLPPPSEQGCKAYEYVTPVSMPGTGRTWENTVSGCRQRCKEHPRCKEFTWWANRACHLNDGNEQKRAAPKTWTRPLHGSVEKDLSGEDSDNKCGDPNNKEFDLPEGDERDKHGAISGWRNQNTCPLLMYIDGRMVDISQSRKGRSSNYKNDVLFGKGKNKEHYPNRVDEDGNEIEDPQNMQVKKVNDRVIQIIYDLEGGKTAEVHLVSEGHGPDEIWSCHWNMYICLPNTDEDKFRNPAKYGLPASTGLMGSPDGNSRNDIIDKNGNPITIGPPRRGENWHKVLVDYCYDEHCVDQKDNIMTPHYGGTFEDIKCRNKEYEEDHHISDKDCVLTVDNILEACDDTPEIMKGGCHIDCCMGGCNQIQEIRKELEDNMPDKFNGDEDPNVIGFDDAIEPPPPACKEDALVLTSDDVCPSSDTEVVKLLHTSGTQALPEGSDVLFGIKMDSGGDEDGRTVKIRVNNPFKEQADIFVQYEKSVMGHAYQDPKCREFESVPAGCNDEAVEIEVACNDYENIAPFALVNVYFASRELEGTTEINKCCNAPDYRDEGVVKYTFEVQCACPDNQAATE